VLRLGPLDLTNLGFLVSPVFRRLAGFGPAVLAQFDNGYTSCDTVIDVIYRTVRDKPILGMQAEPLDA
jgi:hypothetical protein